MPKEGEVQSCGINCGAAPASRSWQHNVGEREPKQQGEAVAEELDGETPLSLRGGGGLRVNSRNVPGEQRELPDSGGCQSHCSHRGFPRGSWKYK